MKVVTSGLSFLDIDAYACSIAYAELLRLQGEDAIAYSSATINESVTKTIRSWSVDFSNDYIPGDADTFILVDVSEPDYVEKAVDIDRVEEVIDHHAGYEEFWQNRIGDRADLEFIGAACTQIYERWVVANELSKMSETTARLLISGILDNTLNFEADITAERDRKAYDELLKIANLPSDWTTQYFTECQESIFKDLSTALINDTKMISFKNMDINSIAIGQLVVWDGSIAVGEYRSSVEQTMRSKSVDWFVNVVSISEGKSYFMCSDDSIRHWAEKVLDVQFVNQLAEADRLWLRKEIFKQDQTFSEVDQNAMIIWNYMQLNDKLMKSDVILVLGSHDTRVADKAAQLYIDGYADVLIISGGSGEITKSGFTESEARVFKRIALDAGVPEDNIIAEGDSSDTGENIKFTYEVLQKLDKHFASFIIVQKPYMERRTYATFKKQWPDKDAHIVVTSPDLTFEEYFSNSPIPKKTAISIMVGDLQRIREYPKLGFQIEQDIPDNVWQAYEKLVDAGFTQHLIKF